MFLDERCASIQIWCNFLLRSSVTISFRLALEAYHLIRQEASWTEAQELPIQVLTMTGSSNSWEELRLSCCQGRVIFKTATS